MKWCCIRCTHPTSTFGLKVKLNDSMDVRVSSPYLSLVLDGLGQNIHVPLYILWHDSSQPSILHLQSLEQLSEPATLDGLIDTTNGLVDWQKEGKKKKKERMCSSL